MLIQRSLSVGGDVRMMIINKMLVYNVFGGSYNGIGKGGKVTLNGDWRLVTSGLHQTA